MPLIMSSTGECNIIKNIIGQDEITRFLERLGFVVGSPIIVVSEMGGNMIVNIKDSRIAISRSMANRIVVPF